jgi:hypothetical protein
LLLGELLIWSHKWLCSLFSSNLALSMTLCCISFIVDGAALNLNTIQTDQKLGGTQIDICVGM